MVKKKRKPARKPKKRTRKKKPVGKPVRPGFLSEPEAARELSMHPRSLARNRRKGTGPPAVRIRGSYYYDKAVIAAWEGSSPHPDDFAAEVNPELPAPRPKGKWNAANRETTLQMAGVGRPEEEIIDYLGLEKLSSKDNTAFSESFKLGRTTGLFRIGRQSLQRALESRQPQDRQLALKIFAEQVPQSLVDMFPRGGKKAVAHLEELVEKQRKMRARLAESK